MKLIRSYIFWTYSDAQVSYRWLVLVLCWLIPSCAHTDAPVNEASGNNGKSIAGEGSVFTYRREARSNLSERADTVSVRLISKMASIGGRDELLAFMGEAGETVIWDVTHNDDLWRFAEEPIAADPSDPMRSKGEWICYPASDSSNFSAITLDTTIKQGNVDVRTRVRYEISSLGRESITLNGKQWAAHKVQYRYVYDRWLNGAPRFDSYSTSGVRSYISELGVLAEQRDTITTDGYDYELHFRLYEALLK